MEWLFAVILLVGFHFGETSSIPLKEDNSSLDKLELFCDDICSRSSNNELITDHFKPNICQCPMNSNDTGLQQQNLDIPSPHKIAKRNTLEDITKKINKKSKTLKLLPIEKAKMNLFQKQLPHKFKMKKSAIHLPKTHLPVKPTLHQDIQHRIQKLKARMSATPLLGARGAFSKEELPNIIEQFKKTQEEFKEKMRASSKIEFPAQPDLSNLLKNRVDINAAKVGSIQNKFEKQHKKETDENNNESSANKESGSTTEPSKVSHVPVVVLMPSTTQPASMVRSSNTENVNTENSSNKKSEVISSAIERIKEKQKEAVTKIKDKISSTKIKSKENEEAAKAKK